MARRLGNWIQSYIEYSQHSEAPAHFHLWVAVSTIASALGRKVWFPMELFIWYPNFYIFLIAPPGVATKSTTAKLGMNLLKLVPGVHFAPTSATWQALIDFMTRECFDGTNTEVTVVSSELGQFLRREDFEMLDVLTDLWDGDNEFRHHTRTQGNSLVINPYINLLGCTTPFWLRDAFKEGMISGGFASRCCFVVADKKRHLCAYPTDHSVELSALRADLIFDLKEISHIMGEYQMTPEAREWGRDWYTSHWNGAAPTEEEESCLGFHSRMQGHIHKAAIVLAASRSNERLITVDDMLSAARLVGIIRDGYTRVISAVEASPATKAQGRILAMIERNRSIRESTLKHHFLRVVPAPEIDRIINSLIRAGTISTSREGGRKIITYQGN